MYKWILAVLFAVICSSSDVVGQLTPQKADSEMTRGINIGNSLDAPTETSWGNPPIRESYFSDLRSAGFTAVRIPITWATHIATTWPYSISPAYVDTVDTVVNWALRSGLVVIINAHHEDWLKVAVADSSAAVADSATVRFDSLWSQIATHFRNASDSLIFEILNEPYPMPEADVNSLNSRVLRIIRRTNPTRIVSYSGYMWSNSDQLVSAQIPDSSDKFLIGYYHSYDPWPFGLQGPGTYGSPLDIATTKAKFDQVTAWSRKNNIPVILDEFGFVNKCEYNSRMCAYATDVDQALQHGVGAFAWDDGGDFTTYNRTAGTFNEIKDILIYTYPQSPNGLKIGQLSHSSAIKIQWHNRNTESDSIVVQRRVGNASFADYATIAPADSVFIDSATYVGTSYYYRLKIVTRDSIEMQSYPIMMNVGALYAGSTATPAGFSLSTNYPNPFNPVTVISYSISKRGMVSLRVYDVLGREVSTLVNEVKDAGRYEVRFDGSRLASGVYFDRLTSENELKIGKMILVK